MNLPLRNAIAKRSSRFWTSSECGIAAIIVFVLYFVLGRMCEREIGRSYERELTEASPYRKSAGNHRVGILSKISYYVSRYWDSTCPLFVQQHLYLSRWNRRSRSEVINQVVYLRSKNCGSTSSFNASDGRGRMNVVSKRGLRARGQLVGLASFFLSFSACSPHFVVNSLTCFCCGLSYVSYFL